MAIDQEALIRLIGIAPANQYMLFLGAGTSASSGIPTAGQCIWQWKRDLHLSANYTVPAILLQDMTLPVAQQRIQRWLGLQTGFPASDDASEYGFYIEKTYPTADGRRAYFNSIFGKTVPHIGYEVLAMLLNARKFQWIWTTNFDGLVAKARKPNHTFTLKEIGLDTSFRVEQLREDEPVSYLVQLHGDYRYDTLRNTLTETQALDTALRQQLINRLNSRPLVVVGYGGRDESVMKTLEDACAVPARGGGLYWCIPHGQVVSGRVRALIEKAKTNGYDADIVEIDSFDDFMIRLGKYVFQTGEAARELEALLSARPPEASPFALTGYQMQAAWLPSNTYQAQFPEELYQFDPKGLQTWQELRQMVGQEPVVAGLYRRKVIAIGSEEDIARIFSGKLGSKIERVPVGTEDWESLNGVIQSLYLEAFCFSLAAKASLRLTGRNLIWNPATKRSGIYKGQTVVSHDAVRIEVSIAGKQVFISLIPDLHVCLPDGQLPSRESAKECKRQAFAMQYNRNYHDWVTAWQQRLFPAQEGQTVTYPPGKVGGFQFRILPRVVHATVMAKGGPASGVRKELFEAIILEEPRLVFGGVTGVGEKEVHPIRGIVRHGPYDQQLTTSGAYRDIRLGVICASEFHRPLAAFLNQLNYPHTRVETHTDYLQQYPGFQQAYRIPLIIPSPTEPQWRILPALQLNLSDPIGSQRLISSAISREIETLAASASVDTVVVFVPTAWTPYRTIANEHLRFDLHDFVKAFAVQKGIRTQFLEEVTLADYQQCRILWWLAQAVYVKSYRTPFVLDADDAESVYVGIGYGIDHSAPGKPITIGCSHIYDAAGQGLRYQLSRVQDPILLGRRKSPFLKKEDAYKIGVQVRQLFYETYHKLPNRVVVHKRTPFLESEKQGLAQALKGVQALELLTIEEEDGWRYFAYDSGRNRVDPYPLLRGTAIILDSRQFLLWVHGKCPSISANYYQGKARIPAPLRIMRYAGNSSIEQISREILGLSKMDWNSFELYGHLPATLQTSGAIARIGRLLTSFGRETYDYRLFM